MPSKKLKIEPIFIKRASLDIADTPTDGVSMSLLKYNKQSAKQETYTTITDCPTVMHSSYVHWFEIFGVHELAALKQLAEGFGLHPLVTDDIIEPEQRPKAVDYGEYFFIVLQHLTYNKKKKAIDSSQISFILQSHGVISFEMDGSTVFQPIRERILTGKGQVREKGADVLLYSLLDAIIDDYFDVLEEIGDELERLEEQLIKTPSQYTVHTIHRLKRDMIFLRKSVWPLREVINNLYNAKSSLIGKDLWFYLKDLNDHTIQIMDMIDSYRDMLSGMLDMYLSSMSNRLNSVMKVLTVISTIFMPLTFIAGVYGMNFQHMPELRSIWGYPAVLGFMASIAIIMMIYFKRKKWL